MARIRAQTVYSLACGQCGDGTETVLFWSLASRIAWMREHAAATGHDGYLVQDLERLVTENHCPLCNQELSQQPDDPLGRDDQGDPWPAARCSEHGRWGRRHNGDLVPVDDG